MVRRGILGGTFDPPHIAHLVAGEVARRELELDVVTFIPAGSPWQKADEQLSAPGDRWEMIRLAVTGVDYFEPDDREIRREGWTYTVDTLSEFPDDDLVLILGSDAAAGLPTWHRYEEVVAAADVAVAPRPGTPHADVAAALPGGFVWLDAPLLDLSARSLRRRVAEGRSIRFLVPDSVADYVDEHGLYRDRSPADETPDAM